MKFAASRRFGPGLLLAATSIGGSHLVLAPSAGARFGYELLWLVVVAHAFKYHAFEFGPRYAVAAGESLLAGYMRLPGPRGWALWLGLIDVILESVGVLAAVAGLSGAVLAAAFGGLGVAGWTGVSVLVVFVLLFSGRYRLLTIVSAFLLFGLCAGTALAFAARPPSLGELSHLVRPALPAGSLLLVSALLGWMPTGVGVSVWHSLWIGEDPRFRSSTAAERTLRFGDALRDMRFGYLLSAIAGVMFLSLGAEVLQPRGLVPDGLDTPLTLARLYTEILGNWMQPVFLMVAFFAMFSTTYTVMDGMPRTVVAAIRHLCGTPNADRADRGRLYWGYLVGMTALSLLVVRLVPNPVTLITVLGAVTFVASPVYCALNYVCVTRYIAEPAFRPGRLARWWALLGVCFMTGTAILLLYSELIARRTAG